MTAVESSPTIHKIISAAITSSTPPGPESIIDAVDLHIGPFNPSTALPLTDGLLEVRLVNMDIDDVTEYFNIFDEDGNMLKTRSGKIMRRILRKLAEGQPDQSGDTSTLLNPECVEELKAGALV